MHPATPANGSSPGKRSPSRQLMTTLRIPMHSSPSRGDESPRRISTVVWRSCLLIVGLVALNAALAGVILSAVRGFSRFVNLACLRLRLPHATCGVCMLKRGMQKAYFLIWACRPGQVLMQPPAMQNAQQPVHAFLGHKAQREGTAGNTDTIDGADGRSPAQGMSACGTLGQWHSHRMRVVLLMT